MMDAPPAFSFAKEQVTQVLTLSTAIIAVTITFAKDLKIGRDKLSLGLTIASWCLFLMSIGFGILAFGALTGTLDDARDTLGAAGAQMPTIYDTTIISFGVLQMAFFLVGLLFLIFNTFTGLRKT